MWNEIILQAKKIGIKGSFTRNVSIASSWTILGILAQFILSPIITRLYEPNEYGLFAVFSSIAVNIVLISSLKYNEAIIIAERPNQRNNIIVLSVFWVFLAALLSSIAIYLVGDYLMLSLNVIHLNKILYLIPLAVVMAGMLDILAAINISRQKFFTNGLSGFFLNVCSRIFTILYGVMVQPKVLGLVGGDLLGKVIGITVMLFSVKNLKKIIVTFFSTISLKRIKFVAYQHRYFPLYVLPTNVLISISAHLPIYFFQFQFNSDVVGYYALAASFLEIINRFLPYSISSVFFPKAVALKKESHNQLNMIVYQLYWFTFALSSFIFICGALFSKTIFPLIFGDSWRNAGLFAGILSMQYAINFIAISLSDVYKVLGRQRFLLTITFVSIMLKMVAFVFIIYLRLDVKLALLWFCIAGSVGGIMQIVGIFFGLHMMAWKVSFSLVILLLALIAVVSFVNIW